MKCKLLPTGFELESTCLFYKTTTVSSAAFLAISSVRDYNDIFRITAFLTHHVLKIMSIHIAVSLTLSPYRGVRPPPPKGVS